MHTHIHTYIHNYISTYCTYMHSYIDTYMHTYIQDILSTYTHTYIHTCIIAYTLFRHLLQSILMQYSCFHFDKNKHRFRTNVYKNSEIMLPRHMPGNCPIKAFLFAIGCINFTNNRFILIPLDYTLMYHC